jgi:hypothetical protein
MKLASARKGGKALTGTERDELSPEALVRACHDILNAAAALIINVEMMAEYAPESTDGPSIAEDARLSVQRIAMVAQVIQAAARARCPVVTQETLEEFARVV